MPEPLPDADQHRGSTLVLALLSLLVGGISGLVASHFGSCCSVPTHYGGRSSRWRMARGR
jgi:hypothetical protein